jgi:hypothetical protein
LVSLDSLSIVEYDQFDKLLESDITYFVESNYPQLIKELADDGIFVVGFAFGKTYKIENLRPIILDGLKIAFAYIGGIFAIWRGFRAIMLNKY